MTTFILDGVEKLTSVYVMLGAACNMRCRHCIEVKMPRLKKVVSPEVLEYLKLLTSTKRLKLVFFGGEPLLYKEQLHTIVEAVEGNADVTVITNGSYLTDDDVEWMNTNNVAVAFSNDGPLTHLTGRDNLLENPAFVERFLKLKRKGIEGVIHAYSQDFQAVLEYFEEKAPGVPVYLGDLVVTQLCPDDYVCYDQETLRRNEERIVAETEKMLEGKPFNYSFVDLAARKASIAMARLKGTLKNGYACGVIGHTLNIDLQGNVFLCHACDVKLGTIFDPLCDLQKRSHDIAEQTRKQDEDAKGCTTCEVNCFCAGKCPLEPPSANQKKGCEAVISLWRAVDKVVAMMGERNENP